MREARGATTTRRTPSSIITAASASAAPSSVASPSASSPSSSKVLKTVKVELADRAYPIYIGNGLLTSDSGGALLRKHIPGKRVLIVTNETIAPLYLDA